LLKKRRIYDIIIPVYGALPYVRQCINSVLENTKHPYNLVIVDDGNGPIVEEYLRTIESARIITNKKNLGWLKSCNIGIKNSDNDVVLLNSDTIVTEGWLEKMDRCAYSNSRIGMVNPLSNNATFLSLPNPLTFNGIPAGFTLESFSNLVSELSERKYPSIPTVLAFCILIKRKLFDHIGLFDEKFELGYGEDDDFYMRAKGEGYKAVCCDDTFVYHYGKKSFGDTPNMKVYRARAYEKFIREYGNAYEKSLNKFNKNSPLTYLHTKLLMKISEISPEYKDKVSIIMPVYNREEYLEEAIRSVLSQSYSNFELIIVDDGSTDNSINIAKRIADWDERITVISLDENKGCAVARNEGLKKARGEFITQFDSDDVMLPDAIKSRIEFLNSNPEVELVFAKISGYIDKHGKPIESKYSEYIQNAESFYEMKKDYDFYDKLRRLELWIPSANVTCMFRRTLLFQEGYYDESVDRGTDVEFFSRIVKGSRISFLDEPLLLHRLHDTNISKKIDRNTGGWTIWSQKPEYVLEFQYLREIMPHRRIDYDGNGIYEKTGKKVKILTDKGTELMNKSEKTCSKGNHLESNLLIGQVAHMAELIDRLWFQIKEQGSVIVAKDQHMNNLNRVIEQKNQYISSLSAEISQIKKHSLLYNIVAGFWRRLRRLVRRQLSG